MPTLDAGPRPGRAAARTRWALALVLVAVGLADLVVLAVGPPERAPTAPHTITAPPAVPPVPASPDTGPVFLRHYYALLPRDTAAAWALLGPEARTRSGGLGRFTAFYARIAEVSVDPGPVAVTPSLVTAVIRFRRRDGIVTHERYVFVLSTGADGTPRIGSYQRT